MRTHAKYWVDSATGEVIGLDNCAQFRLANRHRPNIKIISIGDWVIVSKRADIEKYGLLDEHLRLCKLAAAENLKEVKADIATIKSDMELCSPLGRGHLEELLNDLENQAKSLKGKC